MSRPKKVLLFAISVVLIGLQGMAKPLGAALEQIGVPKPSVGITRGIKPCFKVLKTFDQSPVDLLVLPKIPLPKILALLVLMILALPVPMM
jgi:hypothetical protein